MWGRVLSKVELKLDWCSYEAAKYACDKWHYTKSIPTPPLVRIGVWENRKFIGAVIFGRGANNNAYKPYALDMTEGCELVRVALTEHLSSVSRIISIAISMLKKSNSKLRLVVSYADPNHDHIGAIYQAGNWIFTGSTGKDFKAIDKKGRVWHSRQVSRTGFLNQYGSRRIVPKHSDCTLVPLVGKYRYLMPLDPEMRAQILPLAKPYPKRATSKDSVATGDQLVEGGANPTVALKE